MSLESVVPLRVFIETLQITLLKSVNAQALWEPSFLGEYSKFSAYA